MFSVFDGDSVHIFSSSNSLNMHQCCQNDWYLIYFKNLTLNYEAIVTLLA